MSCFNTMLNISNNLRNSVRMYCTKEVTKQFFQNRNPRNLEKMKIANKPMGYHLEKPGRTFWNKLQIISSSRHVTARVIHHSTGPIIEASTKEWAIKRQLYRTTDTSAFINLAKVFAVRCHEFGVTDLRCDIKPTEGGKIEAFLNVLSSEGISLTEPEQFKPHRPWDKDRPEKPWEMEYYVK